ncbi:MAG TPA: hypothetical protein VGL71_12900, partial [Urbifossiella sp.]
DTSELPTPASIKGMSGSSIWQVCYEGLSSKHWTIHDAVIVAVQTGIYREGEIVKGTRWWVVEKLIRHHYSELNGPLSLVVPTGSLDYNPGPV